MHVVTSRKQINLFSKSLFLVRLDFHKFFNLKINLLPVSFKKYFTNLDCIHAYDTRSKQKSKYFLPRYQTNYGKKSLQYFGIKLWSEIPQKIKCLAYISFKKYIKTIYLICMNYLMHDCLFIYFFSFLFNFYSIYLFINFFFSTTILVSDAGILFYLFCFMFFLFISCLLTN